MCCTKALKLFRVIVLVAFAFSIFSCNKNQDKQQQINVSSDTITMNLNIADDGIEEMLQMIENYERFSPTQKEFVKSKFNYLYSEISRYMDENLAGTRKSKLEKNFEKYFIPGTQFSGKSIEIYFNKNISFFNEKNRNERLHRIDLDLLPNMVDSSFFDVDLKKDKFFSEFKKQILASYNTYFKNQKILEQLAGID